MLEKFRVVLGVAFIVLGVFWWCLDANKGEVLGGFSYFLGCLALSSILCCGLAARMSSYQIGIVVSITTLVAAFATVKEHPGADKELRAVRYDIMQRMQLIHSGNASGYHVNQDVIDMAGKGVSSCGLQGLLDMGDLVAALGKAIKLEPEFSVFERILFGKPQSPKDECKAAYRRLREQDKTFFFDLEQKHKDLQLNGYFWRGCVPSSGVNFHEGTPLCSLDCGIAADSN